MHTPDTKGQEELRIVKGILGRTNVLHLAGSVPRSL